MPNCFISSQGTRPKVGLSPNAPTKVAGMRMEPPPSAAVTRGAMRPAIIAADPPLEPPGVLERFQGLRAGPKRRLSLNACVPKIGVLVFPTRRNENETKERKGKKGKKGKLKGRIWGKRCHE